MPKQDYNIIEPMMLTDKQSAAALNLSVTHFRSLVDSGKIPRGIRLGKSRRWSTEELRMWVSNRCPDFVERGKK